MADDMPTINFAKAKQRLETASLYVLAGAFIAGVMFQDAIAEQLGLVKQEELRALSSKVDDIQTAQAAHFEVFNFTNAFNLERAFQADLDAHLEENLNTSAWNTTRIGLERKLQTAKDYKTCILNSDPKVNCELLQKQLLQ